MSTTQTPPKRVMQESKTEAAGSFMTQPWAAQAVVPALSYWSCWVALFVVGGAYRDVNTRKEESFGDQLAG